MLANVLIKVLERAKSWSEEDQQTLAENARDIEARWCRMKVVYAPNHFRVSKQGLLVGRFDCSRRE